MPCHHLEDVCQHCLEKVQTEDSPPEKENLPPKKTITYGQKKFSILKDSTILAILGAGAYYNTKFFLKISSVIFDSSLNMINSLLETITTREE